MNRLLADVRIALRHVRRNRAFSAVAILLLALGGVSLGLAGALFTGAYLRTLLFDIQPNDPSTLGVATVVFLLIALVASYLPARRATLVDPTRALKSE